MTYLNIEIDKILWFDLINNLRNRGCGIRESGAFLLGPLDERRITHYICYDDLDQDCLNSGIVEFHHRGFTKLWAFCKDSKLKVYADVHTHPGSNTRQSTLDINNPMIRQAGHIAIILPHFAQQKDQLLNGAGIYEYLGDKKWLTHTDNNNKVSITTKKNGIFRRIVQSIINWFD